MTSIKEDLGDFRNFLYLAHKFIGLPEPTPLQYKMADNLQHSSSREAIQAFRGCGKSHLSAIFSLWILYHDVDMKILVVSATTKRASEFVKFCKDTINACPHLSHMLPQVGQRDLSYSFDISGAVPSQTPSLTAKGIGAQITGSRGNYIFCDDLEISVNSMSAEAREKLVNLANEFEAVLLPKGKIVYLGTPHSSSSIYNALPSKGYNVNKYPAYGDDGEPSEPSRFPRKLLEKRRKGMGDSAFMLQYMLDTSLADKDKYPLKISDLLIEERLEKGFCFEKYTQTKRQLQLHVKEAKAGDKPYYAKHQGYKVRYTKKILALDPAGSGADDFAYCVLGTKNSFVFVLEQGHWNGFAGSRVEDIKKLAKDYDINEIVVETNFGDDLIINLLQPNINVPITPIRHHIQKEKRIITTLEPILNQHKLVVSKDFLFTKGISQFTNITPIKGSLKHDDYIDCLAMGVKHLNQEIAINVEASLRAAEEERLDIELDRLENIDSAGQPIRHSWIH